MKKIIIAGGTGFLGYLLSSHFIAKGYRVLVLSRSRKNSNEQGISYISWDARSLGVWSHELEGAEVLINFVGKSVDCRYTEKNKAAIYSSRLEATRVLNRAVQACNNPPSLWINASSATIYRHATDRAMDEYEGEYGEGFSVDVCRKWEQAFEKSSLPFTRKVCLRIGIVLGKNGGALSPLARMAKIGLGGKHGDGGQYMTWLHEDDFIRIVQWFLDNPASTGIYNCTAPAPLPNRDFMALLRRALGKSFGLPSPVWLLEIGAFFLRTETELLLKSRWVLPTRLLKEGFRFSFPHAQVALMHLLNIRKKPLL